MTDVVGWIRARLVLVAIAGVVVLLLAAWLWMTADARHKRDAAAASVETSLAGARVKSAADAGGILDRAHAAASASDDLTRKNADEIRTAPGADLRLDPALNRAGRRGLCDRAAYRGSADCLQHPDRAKPAG